MYEYGEFQARRQETVWHTLNRLLVGMIVVVVLVLIAFAFLPELRNQREQYNRVEELRTEIQKEKRLLAAHSREVELLKNDPTYEETVARDRLDLMKEGETIFRIDPAPSPDRSQMHLTR